MRRPLAVMLAATSLLSACSGATTRFYTLEPAAALPPRAYAGAPFRIDAVHIPPSMDRPELVREAGGGRVSVSDNDHWVAPIGELLRRVLTQNLALQLPAGKVIYPDAPKLPEAAGLIVDVLSISSTGGRVTMEASWSLVSPSSAEGQPKYRLRQRVLRLTTDAKGQGVQGNAAELSALAGQMAAAICEDLSQSAP